MLASAAPTPEKVTLCQVIASALHHAASILPKPLRDVFALCALSGRSLEEAATALGLTVGATKTRLFRAHARMRPHLKPVWSEMHHGRVTQERKSTTARRERRIGETP
jgi:DNA-directed RNA polymerase specialized sigma24 family protein